MIMILCFICGTIGLVIGIVEFYRYYATEDTDALYNLIVCVLLFFVGIFGTMSAYKKGHIDALSGNITYELKENKDNTKTWKRNKNPIYLNGLEE